VKLTQHVATLCVAPVSTNSLSLSSMFKQFEQTANTEDGRREEGKKKKRAFEE